mmetsp:Transcript_11212/g.37037  ORF Transcript_11212/g.37037 Transcript_11212/m.37037 type:complete len:259 (+) Transcript_11212:260-1036(+)
MGRGYIDDEGGRALAKLPDLRREASRAAMAFWRCLGPMNLRFSSNSRSSHQKVPAGMCPFPSAQDALASSSFSVRAATSWSACSMAVSASRAATSAVSAASLASKAALEAALAALTALLSAAPLVMRAVLRGWESSDLRIASWALALFRLTTPSDSSVDLLSSSSMASAFAASCRSNSAVALARSVAAASLASASDPASLADASALSASALLASAFVFATSKASVAVAICRCTASTIVCWAAELDGTHVTKGVQSFTS